MAYKVFVWICIYCCMCACIQHCGLHIENSNTHLKMDAVFKIREVNSSCIGTLVVVYNGTIIESQSFVCFIVAKGVIPSGLAHYDVCGQK